MSTEPKPEKYNVAVIGAGFAGISSAAYLAKDGFEVDVYEKNAEVGGRARQLFTDNGYVFDMGPSWYWMPDVFEQFFNDFGYKAADFYELELLDPGFTLVFGQHDVLDIPADFQELCDLFETIEPGSSIKLKEFLAEAEYKYRIGVGKLVYKPGLSILEFLDLDLISGLFKLQVFTDFSTHVKKFFKDPRLIALMEFPVLFLGAMPEDTPALYSLMNYAGLKLGTWYPKGGFGQVIQGMKTVAEKQGVKFHLNTAVDGLAVEARKINQVSCAAGTKSYDGVIAAADYQHVEAKLLDKSYRNYTDKYWNSRVLAPSCLIFYIGLNTEIGRLKHHTLFFDQDLKQHAREIYKNPQWPSKPLFYVCCPSKTDNSVAPEGHENLFVLMPLATGIEDNEVLREQYFQLIMERLEHYTGTAVRNHIDYKKSYCIADFTADYNAYKGNAYGLANTLMQTANLKPALKNKKIKNLFYAGQLTVPGPGVPPSIISGNVAAKQLIKYFKESL
ncbi:NAD(P)/FAD-dependent oxidoreductase [Pedobacter sp. MC2016-24]|uniref:phytoene desaturase family protein n=1 Tax=Pedobacter sp. MC2016-24 TaxID=2780090 RepID=UPI00187F1334|nr:phytoene desaturase family protein [Pedobacter sp. MC2016-24]MBE9602307.1 phytoene desaturase [Pedobacter sp. MC2016-24]